MIASEIHTASERSPKKYVIDTSIMAAHHTGEPPREMATAGPSFCPRLLLIKTGNNNNEIFQSCHKTHGISSKLYMFYFWGFFCLWTKIQEN